MGTRVDLDLTRRANLFAALADPVRLAILGLVIDNPDITNKEICAAMTMAQTNVTYHLMLLTRAGLVTREKRTVFAHYTATPLAERLMEIETGPET